MKKPLLILVWCTVFIPSLQAQWLKKMTDKIKGKSEQAPAPAESEAAAEGDPLAAPAPKVNPSLVIGGDDSLRIDSSFVFDVAVYQESTAITGNNEVVKDGGQDIVIYYSSSLPQFSIQMTSKSTAAKYYFYADFLHESQLSITAINRVASGEKQRLDLEHMEPVFPGETGYVSQLLRTGNKKVIAGVACEEYVAQNLKDDPRVNAQGTSHALVTAHVWVPQEPHTLFHAYGVIPDKYKIQIEKMQIEGSYAPVVLPLEMYLEYGNGDKVYTTTSEIIMGEPRKVNIADIIK
ncbi:hypothetical protein F0L74_14460 [Chitinophaga agrisoli]|uniref:Uncharacterized protein n=1 Tax=Chitinophaga agrisoli TaxID=2607653 RepID=A0A5B2VYF8_9BACT|nr:hypothetical protein [Chitinophaga agrisoli]KAA2243678.1 hypothetical protein F0L74_14460 [Chitinophaga agrisoli]